MRRLRRRSAEPVMRTPLTRRYGARFTNGGFLDRVVLKGRKELGMSLDEEWNEALETWCHNFLLDYLMDGSSEVQPRLQPRMSGDSRTPHVLAISQHSEASASNTTSLVMPRRKESPTPCTLALQPDQDESRPSLNRRPVVAVPTISCLSLSVPHRKQTPLQHRVESTLVGHPFSFMTSDDASHASSVTFGSCMPYREDFTDEHNEARWSPISCKEARKLKAKQGMISALPREELDKLQMVEIGRLDVTPQKPKRSSLEDSFTTDCTEISDEIPEEVHVYPIDTTWPFA